MIIYKVTNINNNKVYIGQTIGLLESRKKGHLSDVRNNIDNNKFHNAIKKYGKDSFIWEIIDKTDSFEKLNDLEVEYIKLFDSTNDKFGYNTQLGGNLSSPKPVRNATTGIIYNSSTQAEKELKKEGFENISLFNICAVARGDRFNHLGFIFEYIGQENLRDKYIEKTIFVKDNNSSIIFKYPYVKTISEKLNLDFYKLRHRITDVKKPITLDKYTIYKNNMDIKNHVETNKRSDARQYTISGEDKIFYGLEELATYFKLANGSNIATKLRKSDNNSITYKGKTITKLN